MSDTPRTPPITSMINNMGSLSTAASLSPEQERDYFKDKVEHFKILVRNLQEELQSYKLRKEGTATVSKLLQESKQEVVALTRKIRAYESVIRILQSRLEKHGHSSEITLLDDEQYLPSNSKSLIDNLTRENKRLRNVIKTSNTGDPEEFARLQQALNESHTVNGERQARIVELENLLRASDNDKDQTITQLREELSHLNRELNARNLKCSTLAKEAENLQKQLEDVAYQCHDLAKKLKEQSNIKSTETPETTRKEEVPMDVNEDTLALNEENKALKVRVQEITDMNKRWQEYNKQREVYVRQITTELNELKTSQTQQGNSASREFEIQMNHILDDARKHIEEANRQKTQVQTQLDNANRNIIVLTDELRTLKQRQTTGTGASPDSDETIQALKAQIQICTEDFESERKDREKAQTKISRQESELQKLRKEVDDLRRQRERWISSPQAQPLPQTTYTDPFYHYPQMSSTSPSSEGLTARGVTPRGRSIDRYNVIDGAKRDINVEKSDIQKDVANVNDDDQVVTKNRSSEEEYHSLRTSSLSSNSNRASPTPSPKPSGNNSPTQDAPKPPSANNDCLKCPKCEEEYTTVQHSELLEHIEECCE